MEALIQATEKILDEQGPEGVTTIRIASRAGVSIGTLYQCFRNKDAILAAAMERRQKRTQPRPRQATPPPPPPPAARRRAAAPAPPAPRAPRVAPPAPPAPAAPPTQTLEAMVGAAVKRLVDAYAQNLDAMADMPKGDKDAIHRVELKKMAQASEEFLGKHGVPDPAPNAHVLTLSVNKVIKDALRHAADSFTDGRLEKALCRLCIDFAEAEKR